MPRSEKRTLYVASEFPNKKLSLSGGALAHRMRARIHTVRDVCGCTARCVDQHFSKTKRLRNVGSFCCSRSCVWGVTARSILYAIRNGDVRCRPPLDTGAPARTRVHTSLSQATSFRTNGCPSPPLDGLGPPGRHRLRCHPIAYASTRRRARDQASACRISSFFAPADSQGLPDQNPPALPSRSATRSLTK
jgi:hypothetical protein